MAPAPTQPPTLPELPACIRALTDDELVHLRKRFPNVSPHPDRCPTCSGAKSFRWYADLDSRSGEIAEYQCPCAEQWMLHLYLLNSNVGNVYQRLGWADVSVEPKAYAKVQSYFDRLDEYVQVGCGQILYGSIGAGKTLLASQILKRALALGYDGYFTTFAEMIDTYTGGWHDAEEKAWFHRRIKNTQVLVLDDVGREYQGRRQSGLPEATFDEVLRHRVAAGTPTIITTNLDLRKLQEGYGGNVMSLLHERSTTYGFTGEDFRDQARMRLDEEIEQGLRRPVVI